jgi:hypothetical protein
VTRSERPSLALTPLELERWKEAAATSGLTLSAYVRQTVEVRIAENGHVLDLVGVNAAAEILGVSKQRVSQLAAAQGKMPQPLGRLDGRARLWPRSTIEAFAWERRRKHASSLSVPTPSPAPSTENPSEALSACP